VPKFFDNVLSKRAGEAVTLKGHWWDARRDVALEGVKEKNFKVRGCTAVFVAVGWGGVGWAYVLSVAGSRHAHSTVHVWGV
jgi:hypothetical protein